jgi:hypothetical protein
MLEREPGMPITVTVPFFWVLYFSTALTFGGVVMKTVVAVAPVSWLVKSPVYVHPLAAPLSTRFDWAWIGPSLSHSTLFWPEVMNTLMMVQLGIVPFAVAEGEVDGVVAGAGDVVADAEGEVEPCTLTSPVPGQFAVRLPLYSFPFAVLIAITVPEVGLVMLKVMLVLPFWLVNIPS